MTLCKVCTDEVPPLRAQLGYKTCLACGETIARRRVFAFVPVPKSNYVYAHTKEDLVSPYSHKGNR